jgi:glyoxylase-like metal-dependent hydrolase (beta-lactamase superfamily II)
MRTVIARVMGGLLTLSVGIAASGPPQAAQQGSAPPVVYEVYAIRYGTIPDFSLASLVAGADRTERLDIPLMVWLLKGSDGRVVLVDSGFFRDNLVAQWKVRDFVRPSDGVARLGIKPEEVTDIVLTHMHWDHAGGTTLFPKARVWIQKAEYAYYTGDAWQAKTTHGGIKPEDVLEVVRLNVEGRLGLIDGDGQRPLPGIACYTGGRHTYASQYLVVNSKSGRTVVASDNVYLYQNLDKHVPVAGALDAASNLAAQDRMRTQASDVRLIVPGHDPAVFTRFPTVAPGVVRID